MKRLVVNTICKIRFIILAFEEVTVSMTKVVPRNFSDATSGHSTTLSFQC